MIHLLAETSLEPVIIANWLRAFFWLIGGAAAVVGLLVGIKRLREPEGSSMSVQPQPLIVRKADSFPTRDECEARHSRLEQEFGRERLARKSIYDRLELHSGELARLSAETSRQTAALSELKGQIQKTDERIDALPSRLINLLRETKNLI